MTALARAYAWQQFAVCREVGDPDLWFSDDPEDRDAAKAVCRACPVRTDCLDYAIAIEGSAPRSNRHGIAGGLGPGGRRAEYEQRVTAAGQTLREVTHGGHRQRAACGTEAARRRHHRAGEACLRCNTPRPEPQPTAANRRRAA